MNRLSAVLVLSILSASGAIVPVFHADDGRKSYRKTTKIVVDGKAGAFRAVPVSPTGRGLAWQAVSGRFAVPTNACAFALSYKVTAPCDWFDIVVSDTYGNSVAWYDASGRRLGLHPFDFSLRADRPTQVRVVGKIPAGTVSAEVVFGIDEPVIPAQKQLSVEDVAFQPIMPGEALPKQIEPDVEPPYVKSAFKSPSEDPNVTVRYEITDVSGVDWPSVQVYRANDSSKKGVPFVRSGSTITVKPGVPWRTGINVLAVAVRDTAGNEYVWRKVFVIGPPASVPSVTLRDDGVTLVDGKPFFPIGIYGVKPLAANMWNMDRALADLKAGGFNAVHSYVMPRKDEFLDACRKHGFLTWSSAMYATTGDVWLDRFGRFNPNILAWYIGDDTSRLGVQWEVTERNDAIRMIDPFRITCQADGMRSDKRRSKFEKFVNCTDIFLPEIYPVYGNALDPQCIAATVRCMDRVKSEIARFGDGSPRGVWPILQIFHGHSKIWTRYPEHDEIYGMTFAALVHGGTGVTWFHYGDKIALDEQRRYSGCFNTFKDWTLLTNMTHRISSIAPALLARTPEQPPVPSVVKGPAKDPLGQPSVTMLLKRHEGKVYVLAVNASPEPVTAKLTVPKTSVYGDVLWENRRIGRDHDVITDSFARYGVHVYRFDSSLD